MASQIVAGLDGVDRALDPGPSADRPYQSDTPAVPHSLIEALAALRGNACFQQHPGNFFIDY